MNRFRWRGCTVARLAFVLILTLAQGGALAQGKVPALPAYHVDLSQATVSGLSSGAFMTEQFAVAFSSIVSGVGIVAGGLTIAPGNMTRCRCPPSCSRR